MEHLKQKYNRIDNAINKFRWLTSFIVLGSLVLCGVVSFLYFSGIQQAGARIYVLDKNGDIASAVESTEEQTVAIEADNHIRMFYGTFFSYDRNNYKEQVNAGLNLVGESGKRLYETYVNKGWYNSIVNNNLVIKSECPSDSITIRTNTYPYMFTAKGTQMVRRYNVVQLRNLHIEGYLGRVSRKKGINPHGLQIDRLVVIDNSVIKEYQEDEY